MNKSIIYIFKGNAKNLCNDLKEFIENKKEEEIEQRIFK